MTGKRGRPATAEQRVAAYLEAHADASYSRIARACRLFDYRDARRIVRNIERKRVIFTPVQVVAG